MCGIIGSIVKEPESAINRFNAGLKEIEHRGPDNTNFIQTSLQEKEILFGHQRLSIIDLSSDGIQPFISENEEYTLVYNGECYNYIELRETLIRKGYCFKTATDTEVILNLWIEYQEKSLKMIQGMFSFAILEKKNNKLTLARDAFGIKPLYYAKDGENLYFASEVRAVKKFLQNNLEFNWQSIYNYLSEGIYDSKKDTFYKQIENVLPGHFIEFDLKNNDTTICQKSWISYNSIEHTKSFDAFKEELRKRILNSIRIHSRSDVPICVTLSGGIDSSIIACAMRYNFPNKEIHTYSYIADNEDISEEAWVDLINDHIKAKSNKIKINSNGLLDNLIKLIKLQGEPFQSTSLFAQLMVYEEIKKDGKTVVLEGQGADEMFAGYDGYPHMFLKTLIKRSKLRILLIFLFHSIKNKRFNVLKILITSVLPFLVVLKKTYFQNKPNWIDDNFIKSQNLKIERFTNPSGTKRLLSAKLLEDLTKSRIPRLMRHSDRNSMSCSLESRVPFLNLDILDLVLKLPEEYLVSQRGDTKYILRESMRGIVPDTILDRKDKVGFETPEKDWIHALMKQKNLLLEGVSDIPILDKNIIIHLEKLIKNGHYRTVWRILNFIIWYKIEKINEN